MVLSSISQELRNLKNPLYRNSLYISLASVTTAIAGFLFWMIAAKLYPADEVGVASAIVSAINLIFTLSMLGMNFAIIRFYPEYEKKTAGTALILTPLAALIFSIIYGIVINRTESLSSTFTQEFFIIFVFFSVIGTLYNVFSIYAIARRKAEHSFVQSLLFSLRFMFLILLVPFGVIGIVGSFGLGLLLGLIYALIFIDRVVIKLDRDFLKEAFRFSLGNYMANIANIAPNYIMPMIVLTMLGKEEAAYYYMAFAIGNMILLIPNSINMSFFVEGSHGINNFRKTLRRIISVSYVYLTIANVGVWFLGEFVLRFFGEGYINGIGLLRLITLAGFFVVLVNFSITVLNVQKRVKEIVAITIFKAVLFLGSSYVLIPLFGIEGVGWGWIAAYTSALGMLLWLIKEEI